MAQKRQARRIAPLLLALVTTSISLTGCQSGRSQDDVIGVYDGQELRRSALSAAELATLYHAEKDLQEKAQQILEVHYLELWFSKYQANHHLSSLEEAKRDYYGKQVRVSESDIQNFLTTHAKHKELLKIPESQRHFVVQKYLERTAALALDMELVRKAYADKRIVLTGYDKALPFAVSFNGGGHTLYPKKQQAPVTLVEFADYQCSYCVKAYPEIQKVIDHNPETVQFVFMDFPLLDKHPQALPSAIAAKCAENQGKYWDMNHLLMTRKDDLRPELYASFAKKLGLSLVDFQDCQNDPTQSESVKADLIQGLHVGVNQTPFLYINGVPFEGPITFERLQREVNQVIHADFVLPKGFVYLDTVAPTIVNSMRYATDVNFTGRPIPGYDDRTPILTEKAAQALQCAQQKFNADGYSLVVYDAYRPQQAVDYFFRWSQDAQASGMKAWFYPHLDKERLFDLGYIAKKSTHMRGSTVDITLLENGKELKPIHPVSRTLPSGVPFLFLDDNTVDMGSSFDLFDEVSYTESASVGSEALQKRLYLKDTMASCGFENYAKEWWHFTLRDEPFPNTDFDFPVYRPL